MRKSIISIILFFASACLFGQQREGGETSRSEYYALKSKSQKKVGRILLFGGAGLIITSFIIPKGEVTRERNCILCDDEYKNDGIKSAVATSGVIAALSSIPFFIISKKNRQKAMSVSFKRENKQNLQNQHLVRTSFPALKLQVQL